MHNKQFQASFRAVLPWSTSRILDPRFGLAVFLACGRAVRWLAFCFIDLFLFFILFFLFTVMDLESCLITDG